MSQDSDPIEASDTANGERTVALGYLAAVAVATIGCVLTADLLSGANRFVLAFLAAWDGLAALLVLCLNWIVLLLPFLAVRYFVEPANVKRVWVSGLGGALLGILYLPVGAGLHTIDIERGTHPYFREFSQLLNSTSPIYYVVAGLFGGLAYWIVECASFQWLIYFLRDTRPIKFSGGIVSRRVLAAVACVAAFAWAIHAIDRWWPPHV